MQLFKFGLLSTSLFIFTACAHKTPITDGDKSAFCNFERYTVNLDHRNNLKKNLVGLKSLNTVLSEGFSSTDPDAIPKDDMLFISGGSLNGAFGAGVLDGWSKKRGKTSSKPKHINSENPQENYGNLPDFSVVTGVSTGALLSLAAFANKPDAAIDGYIVESESQAIEAFVRRDENGKIGKSAYITALRKGALADISPLKDTTYQIAAKHGLFSDIAIRGFENRKLYAGVVDVDTGEAVALDMTAMAIKIYNLDPNFKFDKGETIRGLKKRAPKIGHYVDCFTSAIAASSSVPLAARPIAIDNRLYIDGGARFLVFGDVIGPIIDPNVKFKSSAREKPIDLYMLINGDQKITPKCGKVDCPDDLTGYNFWDVNGARDDWNVLSLVERTVDVLKTQVGEFSEAEIRFRAFELYLKRQGIDIYELFEAGGPSFGTTGFVRPEGITSQEEDIFEAYVNNKDNYFLKTLKIETETLEHKFEGKTCTEWRKHDEKMDRNLQFHLTYMRCMIDAGQTVMEKEGWK